MTLESLLLNEGQSAELRSCFQVIQETTINDVDKYTEITCHKLGRAIVCRTYAPVLYELCQLVVIASDLDSDRRYENLFWGTGPARRVSFRDWFQKFDKRSRKVEFTSDQIIISYASRTFAITYERMPLLSAFMEFLVTTIGYTLLDDILAPLIKKFPDERLVSDTANNLSRALYSYLQDHLPAAQDQRRRRDFLSFIANRANGGSAVAAINDEVLLDYWLTQDGRDKDNTANDTLTYRGIFKTAVRLINLLRMANDKQGIELALPIGTEYEAGEVEPADVEVAMEEVENLASPLIRLEETAQNGLKILNKRELEKLKQVLYGEAVGTNLTRSIIRNIIFGNTQARITQGLRQGLGHDAIVAIITEEPGSSYEDTFVIFSKLVLHLDRMILITFHVLVQAGHTDAVNAALAIEPNLDLSGFADNELNLEHFSDKDGNVLSLQANLAVKNFLRKAYDANPDNDVGALAQRAVLASKGMARQGFNEAAWQETYVVKLFSEALPALIASKRELFQFLNKHAHGIDWKALFNTDTDCFRRQFSNLYGDKNVQ